MTNYWPDLTKKEKAEIVRDDCLHNRALNDLAAAGGRYAKQTEQQIVGQGARYPKPGVSWEADSGPGDRVPFDGPSVGYDMRTLDGSPLDEPKPAASSQSPSLPTENDASRARPAAPRPQSSHTSASVSAPPECMATVTKGSPQYREPPRGVHLGSSPPSQTMGKSSGSFIRRA